MRLDAKKAAIALVLVAGAAGSWWATRLATPPEPRADYKARHDPDYIIENFHSTILTERGRPQYELSAHRLVHYGDDGSSTIAAPYLIQYGDGRAPAHARAREGWLPEAADYIVLTGNVELARGRDPRGGGGELRAEKLRLQLEKDKRATP